MKKVTKDEFVSYINEKAIVDVEYDHDGAYVTFKDGSIVYLRTVTYEDEQGFLRTEPVYYINE